MDRDKLIEQIIELTGCDVETANKLINLVKENQHNAVVARRYTRYRPNIARAVRGEPKRIRKHPQKGSTYVAKGSGSETDDPGPSKFLIRGIIKGKV